MQPNPELKTETASAKPQTSVAKFMDLNPKTRRQTERESAYPETELFNFCVSDEPFFGPPADH